MADAAPLLPASPARSGVSRILGNFAHLLGGKAAAGVMSLVYLVIVTHRLGAADYGVLVLVNAYAVLIGSLVAFSGFHGVVRYGALALERGDREGFARIVRFLALIELAFGVVAIGLAALLVPVVGPRLGWAPDTVTLAIPYSLAIIATVRATPQGILQIAGRFDLIGLHQAISPTVRLLGATAVWAAGGGLHAFIAVWLAAAIVEGLAMWGLALGAWRRLTEGRRWRGPWRGVGQREQGLVRFVLTTNLDITVRELAPNLAPVTIGWIMGPAAAGLFALAQRATAVLAQPTVLLSQASYAVLADLVAKRDFAGLSRTVWRSAGLALAVAVPVVGVLALLGGRLLTLLGGATFTGGALLLIVVAGARAAGLTGAPLAAGLSALGYAGWSMTVGLIANLALYPLLPLLLWSLGIDGAGWHALVQALFAMVALGLMFGRVLRAQAT